MRDGWIQQQYHYKIKIFLFDVFCVFEACVFQEGLKSQMGGDVKFIFTTLWNVKWFIWLPKIIFIYLKLISAVGLLFYCYTLIDQNWVLMLVAMQARVKIYGTGIGFSAYVGIKLCTLYRYRYQQVRRSAAVRCQQSFFRKLPNELEDIVWSFFDVFRSALI